MKRKTFYTMATIIAAAVITLAWLSFGGADEPAWDVCYPMANANISWNQTYHGGTFGR